MKNILPHSEVVILANGTFPKHKIPLKQLEHAKQIICCDGAIKNLLKFGKSPTVIVGDLDSIPKKYKEQFKPIIHHSPNQDTNDLTKAVEWALNNSINEITILGATGKREDHTLGNISLLSDYAKQLKVKMLTNTGLFTPIHSTNNFASYKGQQISIFSQDPENAISSKGLKYPLQDLKLRNWWMGTLNEAIDTGFEISFNMGNVIVYQEY